MTASGEELEPRNSWGSSTFSQASILSRHRSTLRTTLADRGNTPADVQPAVFLKEMEKVIAVGNLAGDDLFFSLIIGNGEGNLHRFIGRVLLGKVDEFYVEGCLLLSLSLHRHCFSLIPSWALSCSP